MEKCTNNKSRISSKILKYLEPIAEGKFWDKDAQPEEGIPDGNKAFVKVTHFYLWPVATFMTTIRTMENWHGLEVVRRL